MYEPIDRRTTSIHQSKEYQRNKQGHNEPLPDEHIGITTEQREYR